MQDDEFITNEELEYRFEQLLEQLEKGQLVLENLLRNYQINQTDAGAKFLWLEYTKRGLPVPRIVINRMIKAIQKEVNKRPKSWLLPAPLPNHVLPLIHLALSDKDKDLAEFWEILQCSPNNVSPVFLSGVCIDEDILCAAKEAFPIKTELKDIELFKFAANVLKLHDIKRGEKPEELARRRYKTWLKNNI